MPATILSEADIRKEAARRAFYSNHPLIRAYRFQTQQDDIHLRSFIAFVVAMPKPVFNACMLAARRAA